MLYVNTHIAELVLPFRFMLLHMVQDNGCLKLSTNWCSINTIYIYIYKIIIKKNKIKEEEENMPWLFYLMGSPTNFEY
jgi:hypothetical protein